MCRGSINDRACSQSRHNTFVVAEVAATVAILVLM